MSSPTEQNLSNHARYVPGFHFVTGTLVLLNLGWTIYHLYVMRTGSAVEGVAVGVILLSLFWYLRAFPLSVQDRLIRLEERLRLSRLLPADMQSRCDDLTADQLIGLRFASDTEIPELVTKVLNDRIATRADVKKLIKQWRPDYMRA